MRRQSATTDKMGQFGVPSPQPASRISPLRHFLPFSGRERQPFNDFAPQMSKNSANWRKLPQIGQNRGHLQPASATPLPTTRHPMQPATWQRPASTPLISPLRSIALRAHLIKKYKNLYSKSLNGVVTSPSRK